MELFEFLMILLSVIIGLGLTEVLTGTANLLRARSTLRFYWIHSLFQFGVFFALLQLWWESWGMNSLETISFWAVLSILAPSVFLFLTAHLLYPSPVENSDLRAYYYRQAPFLWGLVIAGTVEGTFLRPVVMGDPVFHASNLSGIPMTAICIVLVISKSFRVHSVLAPLILILVILDTLLANPAITAG
jgi:hypothetical protein